MSERYSPHEAYEASKKSESRLEAERSLETEQHATQKEAESKGYYENRGIENVPLSKINFSDNPVKGPQDFHKVSHDEMVRGFQRLETEVRPAVERGATRETFQQYDRANGLSPAQGTERVYSSFYGHDAIQLIKDGDTYSVGKNGYHRLYVARELGLETVPAQVLEKRY